MRTRDIDEEKEVGEKQDQQNEEDLMNIQSERLAEVLKVMNPKYKAILLMKFQDGFSIKEIMQILDLSESAVKMRIKRAKADALNTYNGLYENAEV